MGKCFLTLKEVVNSLPPKIFHFLRIIDHHLISPGPELSELGPVDLVIVFIVLVIITHELIIELIVITHPLEFVNWPGPILFLAADYSPAVYQNQSRLCSRSPWFILFEK